MTRRRKQTTNSAACFAAKQITFALLALNKFLQLLAELITTNKCNLWMHYSVSCPGDRAHLSWKDTPNANSAGVKGTSVTCTNTIHKNNLVKMCLLCTGLRTPEQWLLMELLSKPTLSCSCGHCCARGQPALRFQPDFVSCRQLELPGACLNQIKEKQNRVKGLPCLQLHHRPVFPEVSPALYRLVLLSIHLDGDSCRIWASESWRYRAGAAAMQGLTIKSKENMELSDHPVVSPSSLSLPSWQREGINISLVTTLK